MDSLIDTLDISFARGKWDPDMFLRARNPYTDVYGDWIQEADCIANRIPDGCTANDGLGPRGDEFYVSLMTKAKINPSVKISGRMSFYPQMAPVLSFCNHFKLREDGNFAFDKQVEVVIYNEGINVWRHFGPDVDPNYVRICYASFEMFPDTIYNLEVEIKDAEMKISVADRVIGCYVPELTEPFHTGILGCEGLNRFYDLSIRPL